MSWGKLYGIGVGPGDPELLTLKARRILEQTDTLFIPRSQPGRPSVAQSIVGQALDKQWHIIELLLPMTADESLLEQHWREAAGVIARHLSKGRDGAFVTLGDPTLYSTFTYILKQLRDLNLDIPVEIVPGISAVNAISSTLQQALAEGKEDLVISPALQDQAALNNLIGQFDNIVLMKAGRQIDKICRALEEKGQDKQAFVVSRCGFADAAIHSDIFALRGKEMDYLSTVIIKKKGGAGQ